MYPRHTVAGSVLTSRHVSPRLRTPGGRRVKANLGSAVTSPINSCPRDKAWSGSAAVVISAHDGGSAATRRGNYSFYSDCATAQLQAGSSCIQLYSRPLVVAGGGYNDGATISIVAIVIQFDHRNE